MRYILYRRSCAFKSTPGLSVMLDSGAKFLALLLIKRIKIKRLMYIEKIKKHLVIINTIRLNINLYISKGIVKYIFLHSIVILLFIE